MQYKSVRKSLVSMVLVLAVVFTSVCSMGLVSAANTSLEDKKEELQDELADISERLEKIRGDKAAAKKEAARLNTLLDGIESEMNLVTQAIDALDAEIKPLEERIEEINGNIEKLDDKIQEYEKQIAQKEIEFSRLFDLLKQRLRALYIAGDASALEVLLTSTDISDFLNRYELVKGVAEHDSGLMKQVRALVDEIKGLKTSVEDDKEIQNGLKQEALDAKAILDGKKAEQLSRMEELKSNQNYYNHLVGLSNQLIRDLQRDENKEIDKYIAGENELNAIDDQIKNVIHTGGSSGDASTGNGSKIGMVWPVRGCSTFISSGYGPRWGTIHRGIDIAGGSIYGKSVVAAASGKVILALNTSTGYGKYVIVDHGNGVATLYGHCSELKVSVGQQVTQGQTIALVGSTGNSTGPHLHFEVRINGERVNPMNYL